MPNACAISSPCLVKIHPSRTGCASGSEIFMAVGPCRPACAAPSAPPTGPLAVIQKTSRIKERLPPSRKQRRRRSTRRDKPQFGLFHGGASFVCTDLGAFLFRTLAPFLRWAESKIRQPGLAAIIAMAVIALQPAKISVMTSVGWRVETLP